MGTKTMRTSWACETSGLGPQLSVWEWGAALTVGVRVCSHLESPSSWGRSALELPTYGGGITFPRALTVGLLLPSALAALPAQIHPKLKLSPPCHTLQPTHCTAPTPDLFFSQGSS